MREFSQVNLVAQGTHERHREKILRSPCELPGDRGLFQRALFGMLGFLVRSFCRLEVEGRENLPSAGGYLLCPNHSSHLDAFVVAMSLPAKDRFKMVSFAAQGYFAKGLLRYMAGLVGAILIKRRAVSIAALRAGVHAIDQELPLLIFPEGTRSRSGDLGKFHKGAAHVAIFGNSPIVPVKIEGTFQILPPRSVLPRIAGNWGIGKRPSIRVSFLPCVVPSSNEERPENLTEQLRVAISGA